MTDRSADWAARRRAWEAERLAPSLERAPERRTRFSTISDTTIERLYGPWSLGRGGPPRHRRLSRRAAVHPRHPPDRLSEPALDDADVRGLRRGRGHERPVPPAPRRRPDRACRSPTTCRPCTATTPTTPRRRASSGRAASASRAWPTWRSCSTGLPLDARLDLDDDQLARPRRSGRCTSWPPRRPASRATRLEGTTQNDILKEFVAQKEFLFPPEPSMRLVTDTIEFGTREMPRWNTVSISGYHIREAGSTAIQELAFTIADGMAYVEAALARGLRIDDFAPRLSRSSSTATATSSRRSPSSARRAGSGRS